MRILVVNPFGIGDVLFSTPLISNLRSAFPESYIGYICNVRAKDALYNNPEINEVFIFEKDEYRKLWKQAKLKCMQKFFAFLALIKSKRFDVVIDLSLGYQYSLFLWLLGIKKRVGYNYRDRGRFLTQKIGLSGYEDKPVADYYLDLLKFLAVAPRQFPLKMYVSAQEEQWADEFFRNNNLRDDNFIVGIIPAGGASWGKSFSYRHWAWEKYAQLSDRLIAELGAKIIIFGDYTEEGICQKVQGAMRQRHLSLCAKTKLKEFAACLAKCSVVVCNDGGPLHVAVSQDVRTVSIFGPVDEQVYGPYPQGGRHIVVTRNIPCRPCYRRFKVPECKLNRQCIRDITVDEVFAIIKPLAPMKG